MEVLRAAKSCGVYTKSSIMLGLGEMDDEIIDTMLDLKVGHVMQSVLALTPLSLREMYVASLQFKEART